MQYQIEFKRRAIKDLRAIPIKDRRALIERIDALEFDLAGDVKKLTNFTPEYRLRSGQWRVLFEIEGNSAIIYRVLNRRDAYRSNK